MRKKLPPSWYFNPQRKDYGIDLIGEIPEDPLLKGNHFAGQLRSHSSLDKNADNTISQYVKYMHWNYWKNHKLPFFLFVADITHEKVYWMNIHEMEIQKKKGQKGTTLRIPVKNDLDLETSLKEIEEYVLINQEVYLPSKVRFNGIRDFIFKYDISRLLNEKEVQQVQVFLDDFNGYLDKTFPLIKKIFFPNTWKIGIAVYTSSKDKNLGFALFPIPSGYNIPQIIEIPTATWENLWKNPIFPKVYSWSKEVFLKEPRKIAKNEIITLLTALFENRVLDIQGNRFLAEEVVFATAQKFFVQMGLEKKDEYTIEELVKGLYCFLPIWIEECLRFVEKDFLANMLHRNRYFDPESLLFGLHSIYKSEVRKRVIKRLQEKPQKIPRFRIDNREIPIRLLHKLLDYLSRIQVNTIKRVYRPPDYERMRDKGLSLSFNKFRPEDLETNIRILFKNLPDAYNTILNNNFPHLKKDLPIFSGATTILVELDLKDQYRSKTDYPLLYTLHLKNEDENDLTVEVFSKSENKILAIEPDRGKLRFGHKFHYNGIEYIIHKSYFGNIPYFIFEELPLFKFVYNLTSTTKVNFTYFASSI